MLTPCTVPVADQRYTTKRIISDPDSNRHHDHEAEENRKWNHADSKLSKQLKENQLESFLIRHQ